MIHIYTWYDEYIGYSILYMWLDLWEPIQIVQELKIHFIA